MAEKRKFDLVICVKINAKTAFKIEFFDASQWLKSAQGRYRLRINRRWRDLPEGGHAYLDMAQAAALVGALAQGESLALEPAPEISRGTLVSVANGNTACGVAWRDITRTATPAVRGYDGRWHVGVMTYGQGVVFVPVADLIVMPEHKGGKRRVEGGLKMSKRNSLLAKVHIARKDLGLDEAAYRGMLRGVLGVDSAKDATDRQLGMLIGQLRRLGWDEKPPRRDFPVPKGVTLPEARQGCAALMGKIGAQLADARRPWSYAAALAKRICKVDALEWCKPEDLRKIIAALDYDAKRRARRAA